MPDSILGLPTSAKYQAAGDRFNAHRRQILNIAPNGGSPLTALLSMIPSEPLTDSIYYWYEKRFKVSQAALRGTNPVTTTVPTDGDTDDGTAVTATSVAITTALYIRLILRATFTPGKSSFLTLTTTFSSVLRALFVALQTRPLRATLSSTFNALLRWLRSPLRLLLAPSCVLLAARTVKVKPALELPALA